MTGLDTMVANTVAVGAGTGFDAYHLADPVIVGDVVVCYRCLAHYRGVPSLAGFPPYELGIAERYRQEKIRLEQLQAAKKPRSP